MTIENDQLQNAAASSYEETLLDPAYVIEKEEAEPLPEDPMTYQRPTNEDDDDYDPWSDRPAETPMFEEDPWN